MTTPDRLDIFHLRFLIDLMHTRKLGATAQNFDMSTATASRMLQRLRDAFDDPLFVRGPTGLTPTEAAMRLEEPVRRNIEAFDRLTAPSVFAPEAAERRLVIASCGAVFPEVIERVASELFARAPGLKLTLLHRTPHLWEDLHEGAVDMALVSGFSLPPGLRKMLLFRSPAGVVVRRDHPLARLGRPISPAEAGAYPRLTVLVNSDAGRPTYERVLTGTTDRSRREDEAAVTAESVYDILPVLESTDAVLFAPETAGRVSARHYAWCGCLSERAEVATSKCTSSGPSISTSNPPRCGCAASFRKPPRSASERRNSRTSRLRPCANDRNKTKPPRMGRSCCREARAIGRPFAPGRRRTTSSKNAQ